MNFPGCTVVGKMAVEASWDGGPDGTLNNQPPLIRLPCKKWAICWVSQ